MNTLSEHPAIRVTHLVVGFGDRIVLNDLELEVNRGEILGVVGASGGGKSVLLRTILGLLPKRRGTIEILGSILDAETDVIKSIGHRCGVMFQQGALFSSLTTLENDRWW